MSDTENKLTTAAAQGYTSKDKAATSKPTQKKPNSRAATNANRDRTPSYEGKRPQRKKLSEIKRKFLGVSNRPGFKTRVVLNEGTRIEDFMANGYIPRQKSTPLDSKNLPYEISQLGNVQTIMLNGSSGQLGVVMDIPEEFFEENQREKMQEVDAITDAITAPASPEFYSKTVVEDNSTRGR